MPIVKGKVNSIVRYENTVFLGGEFDSVGGIYKQKLAAFDAITGAVLPWDPQPNGNVYKLIVADGKLVVGGNFTDISSSGIGKIAVYNLSNLTLFNYNISTSTCDALYWDNISYVYFNNGFVDIKKFALNTGIVDPVWNIPLGFGDVESISGSPDHIYIAGDNLANFPNSKSKLARAYNPQVI